jgi:hypothetical protein
VARDALVEPVQDAHGSKTTFPWRFSYGTRSIIASKRPRRIHPV